jgi:hypothetical protein
MTAYEILIKTGHSAAKAAEIVLDAQRGDAFSVDWIRCCKKLLNPSTPADPPRGDNISPSPLGDADNDDFATIPHLGPVA